MKVASPLCVAIWMSITVAGAAALVEMLVLIQMGPNIFSEAQITTIHWIGVLAIPLVMGGVAFGSMLWFFKRMVLNKLVDDFKLFDRIERVKSTQKESQLGLSTDWDKFLRNRAKLWNSNQSTKLEALQDQDDFRKNFIGNLAHELKTPLQSIQGYVLSLLDGAMDDPERSHRFLQKAAKNAERMGNLLNDLDVITKEEGGRLDLEIVEFDIIDVVKEVIDSEERRAQRAMIKLTIDSESPVSLYAKGDSGWITQVLSNLVVNSVNYGRQDGSGETHVRVREETDKVYVEVEDNGIGIDEESQERIFERFYRVDKSRSRLAGGSGLGLAICKHLIEAHNENIQVQSEVGKGSMFYFRLPKA